MSIVNIKQVAEICNVSVATVSRVINKKGNVKKETKEKILKAINELDYVPNALARNLSRNDSDIIGVIIPDVGNAFYLQLIKGVMSAATEKELNVVFYSTDGSMEKEVKFLKLLREQRIKGAVLISCVRKNQEKKLKENLETLGIPLILLNKFIENIPLDGVFTDDIMAAYLLTETLLKEGHEDIVLVTGAEDSIVANNRVSGYKKALKDYGKEIKTENIIFADFNNAKNSFNIIKNEFSNNIPKAIIAGNNNITMGCMKYLRQNNKKVGKDAALVAFDSISVLEWLDIYLTVVSQNPYEMGQEAFNMLLDRIENPEMPINRVHVVPELIIKGSEKTNKKLK